MCHEVEMKPVFVLVYCLGRVLLAYKIIFRGE
jgi:hypothetical protein